MSFEQDLSAMTGGRVGLALVQTDDEKQVLVKVKSVARSFKNGNVMVWSTTGGLRAADKAPDPNGGDPNAFFSQFDDWKAGPSFVLAFDLCSVVNKLPTAVVIARSAKDFVDRMKTADSAAFVQVVIVDRETASIPMGITEIDFPVPDRREMGGILDAIAKVAEVPEFNREIALNGLMGLPAIQAENAVSMSIVKSGKIDPVCLRDYKKAMINAAGLEWVEPDPRGMAGIGGLENLKRWALEVKAGFDPVKAAEFDLPPPCGMLMAGVPGTGKSATAKALAGEWGFVLLRYNGGAMNKYQGESENNFRKMLQTAEAVAPAILFIDEAEKVLAAGSGETDGGTSERIAGEFLTWLQEKKAPVFVVLTANDPEKMRAELLRAGRLEAKFWLDVPNLSERLAIVDVFCKKYGKVKDIDRAAVARASDGWTGAEIESAIKETLRGCMISGATVTTETVIAKLRGTPKVAESFKRVKDLRDWASRACMMASVPDAEAPDTGGTFTRKIGV
jgi:hypothetical protein